MLAAAALAVAGAPAAQGPMPGVSAPYTIARTMVATIPAPDGAPYRLFVAWPEGEPPATGWPVLYLLDGADNFATYVETARRLARNGRSGLEPGVVVGIDSGTLPRRVLDYTPAAIAIPAGFPAHGLRTGGGDAFLDAVAERILPWVAARWRVDPKRRMLAGHSFGGVLALHAAWTRPGLFAASAAVSPSLWFGDGLVAREAAAAPAGSRVLIAMGGDERSPVARTPMDVAAIATLARRRGGGVRAVTYSGQSHGTTMLAAAGDVLALAFRDAR